MEASITLLGIVPVELTCGRTVLAPLVKVSKMYLVTLAKETYTALQWAAIDVVSTELTDGHGGIFMRVHLDKRKSSVGLKTSFEDITEVLEQRNDVVLRGVRG